MSIRAVIFDLGGVVLGSPLHAIRDYERELGIPEDFVNRVVVATGPGGAWSRLERGELTLEAFYGAFEAECADAGHALSAREMMLRIGAAAAPRPAMIEAIRRLRDGGFPVAALTNNWTAADGHHGHTDGDLRALFDVFVESVVEGLRKPDPRIYRLTCERLGVAPPEAAFLDDIGRNLKSARELGMTTVKVDDPDEALATLGGIVGLRLAS